MARGPRCEPGHRPVPFALSKGTSMTSSRMRVLLFGASGMVGGGVLRECLLAPDVGQVVSVGRSALRLEHAKLMQAVRPNFAADPAAISDDDLRGVDACFFCLGVSA